MKQLCLFMCIVLAVTAFGILGYTADNDTIKIACVGDSITYGAGLQERETESYPAQLQQLLGSGYTVQNFGVSSTTALKDATPPYVGTQEYTASLAFKPDILVIMLGTNDIKGSNWETGKAQFKSDYLSIIQSYVSANPNVKIFVGLPPRIFKADVYASGTTRDPAVLENEAFPLIREIAKEVDGTLVDIFSATINSGDLFPDYLHPNAQGAGILAQTVANAIQSAKSEAKGESAAPVATSSPAVNPVTAAERMTALTFTAADGTKLLYRLYVPKDYDPAKKYSFLLFLHGAGNRGNDNLSQISVNTGLLDRIMGGETVVYDGKAVDTSQEFIIVAPQCPKDCQWVNTPWDAVPDPSYSLDEIPQSVNSTAVSQLIEVMRRKYNIDENRIYATGLSMGGFGIWDLTLRYPDLFAAIIPLGGGGDPTHAQDIKDIPIWTIHQYLDPLVRSDGTQSMVKALKKAGGNVKLTLYFDLKHNAWDKGYAEPELLQWLYSHTKDNRTPVDSKIAAVSDWAVDEIALADALGFIPDGTGEMLSDATRLTFCKIVAAMFPDMEAGSAPFTDTKDPAVAKAYNLGITNGVSDTEFAPDNPVTREEISTMLYRAYLLLGAAPAEGTAEFADAALISDWALESVGAMAQLEIVKGDEGNMRPQDHTTAEEAVILALRTYLTGNSNVTKNIQ